MKIRNIYLLFIILISIISLSTLVLAQLDLPPGLQRVAQYNEELALFYLQNLSFIVAFLAGILSLLSPCILPILPAFFAYTFKEKRNVTKMTFIFFLGFSLIFVIFGLIASAIGQSLASFQANNRILILFAGIFLVIFGLMSLFGRGFSSFIKIYKKFKNDVLGTFLFGIAFAIGWSACLGPILAGILLIAATFGNFFHSGLLLFVYSLGIFVPLFLLSFLSDKYNFTQSKLIRKELNFGKIKIRLTNLIAGLLFIMIGLAFIIYRGTVFINVFDPLKTRQLFYTIQNKLISSNLSVIIGLLILIIFLILLWKFLRRKNK